MRKKIKKIWGKRRETKGKMRKDWRNILSLAHLGVRGWLRPWSRKTLAWTKIPVLSVILVLLNHNTVTKVDQICRWSAISYSITCAITRFMLWSVCLEPVITCWCRGIIKWRHYCTSVCNICYNTVACKWPRQLPKSCVSGPQISRWPLTQKRYTHDHDPLHSAASWNLNVLLLFTTTMKIKTS